MLPRRRMPLWPVLGGGRGQAAVWSRCPVVGNLAPILRRRFASSALRGARNGRPRATREGARGPRAGSQIVSRRIVRVAMRGCVRPSIFLSRGGACANHARRPGKAKPAGEMARRAESSKCLEKTDAKCGRPHPERVAGAAGGGCPRRGGRFRKIGLRACKFHPGGLAFQKALPGWVGVVGWGQNTPIF